MIFLTCVYFPIFSLNSEKPKLSGCLYWHSTKNICIVNVLILWFSEMKLLPSLCLEPIARTQLGTCLSHSEATAHPCSPLVIACIVHTPSLYMWSIKIPAEPRPRIHILFICTPRHGSSAQPALPMARRIRPVSEKKKRNSPGIHLCSQLNHCPQG